MSTVDTMTREGSRVIVQYLEGGVSGSIDPDAAVERLRRAASVLPVDDVCLGWNLPRGLLEPVAAAARDLGASVWLWHPLLSGDGRFVPGPHRVVGVSGHAVVAHRDQAEFAFDCPVDPAGLGAALQRLVAAIDDGPWDGVFLDKIRWPSPYADPARDLGCWCDHCHRVAQAAGVDAAAVRALLIDAAIRPEGRAALATALVGGPMDPVLSAWLDWRCDVITDVVAAAAGLVAQRDLRLSLDVFAPVLARSVGQDLRALGPKAEFTKSMLYLGTHGPAGMAHELLGLQLWLQAGGIGSPQGLLGAALGYPVPGPRELVDGSLPIVVLETELDTLVRLAGPGAAAGVDAVQLPGLAVLDDHGLREAALRVAAARLPLVVSWDLWHVTDRRLAVIADALSAAPPVTGCLA